MSAAPLDLGRTFDAIIVGAGPAGCVLASRLSEQADKDILLVEAGPDVAAPGAERPDLLNPYALVASNNPTFRWPGLFAETGAAPGDGSPRASVPYLQARGVGGASNINGMGVDRGQPGDYDDWCSHGLEGWGWKDVLPYFNKLERDRDFPGPGTPPMHGADGPIPVRRLPRSRWAPFAAAIGDTLERRGFGFMEDYTTEFREGFSAAPMNSLPDRRVSAAMGYLGPEVRRRRNLVILSDTRVDRLSLQNRRANGVYLEIGGVPTLVRGRQIIVSGGAIQSPALLMRSGIGGAGDLTKHGIAVVLDSPGVGANLQNHPCVMIATYLTPAAAQRADNPTLLQNWLRYSSGHPECDPCDMHLMPFNRCDWHALGGRVGAVAVTVLKPYSKGQVALSSADPGQMPTVKFNLLDDSRDLERLVDGLRFVLELLMDPQVAKMHHEVFVPGRVLAAAIGRRTAWNGVVASAMAAVLDRSLLRRGLLASSRLDPRAVLADDDGLRRFVRRHAQPQYHPCGTCRMGAASDATAVVDEVGRVRGMESLRVVDASIFPSIPRAYTHVLVIMAAEKMADAIKAEWRSTRVQAS